VRAGAGDGDRGAGAQPGGRRRPLYGLADSAAGYEPAQLGLAPGQAALCNDDRAGRALDALFEADRARKSA